MDKVVQMGQTTVQTVKDMSMNVYSRTLETSYGQYVAGKVNDALTLSEGYINKYLPAEEVEEKENGKCLVIKSPGRWCFNEGEGLSSFHSYCFEFINCLIFHTLSKKL